jgi:hypothetical protein
MVAASVLPNVPPLYEVKSDGIEGTLEFNFHAGQSRAWYASERIIAVIAGTQGGKTSFGSLWMYREMRERGAGDYLIAAPTFPLLDLKLIPEFKRLFVQILGLGTFTSQPNPKFTLSPEGELKLFGALQTVPTIVHFGYAANPDSLESMTAKAAWLDEAGQKGFKVASYEAVMRRLSLAMGRLLITTTPYGVTWLKSRIFDKRNDPLESIKVVQFKSSENPAFPKEEIDRARRDLPGWRFRMMYEGEYARPAGMIYDNFDTAMHMTPRFALPERWPRYVGLDFGGINTAALFYALDPLMQKYYLYRIYLAGRRTAAQHVIAMKRGEPTFAKVFGGAKSEDHWRLEYKNAGMPVEVPKVNDVELGIDRVYAAHSADDIIVFDDLQPYIDQKLSYSREVDENGEPTDKINDKNKYHYLDAERYVIPSVRGVSNTSGYTVTENASMR